MIHFKHYIFLFLFCSNLGTIAQTKMIWHKSHSGNTDNFRQALENNLFALDWSNFGAPPRPTIKNAKDECLIKLLDSLIFTKDNKIVMITSEYCKHRQESVHEMLWKAGKDTLENHSLFSQNHHLDKIKRVLKKRYNFQNNIDEVVFIGYDNEKNIQKKNKNEKNIPESPSKLNPEIKKQQILLPSTNTQKPNNNQPLLIYTLIGITFVLSVVLAWFTRKLSKIKTSNKL